MKSFIAGALLAVASVAMSSGAEARAATGIPGYIDTTTGVFTPYVQKVPAATSVARTGKVAVTIALNIQPAIGADEPISCTVSISAFDASFSNSASSAGVVSRTGTKGSVTISIPYQWTMKAAGETAIVTVSCSEGVSSFTPGGVAHSISFTVPGFAVPATAGATTKISLAASL
jgi:hypothetical protein